MGVPDRPGAGGFRASDLQVLSNVFLRMIKSLVAPLLFATLVVGIAGHGDDMKRIGTLAVRSFIYFEVVTALALVVGLLAANVAKPGSGVTLAPATRGVGAQPTVTTSAFGSVLEHIVPQSFIDAAARVDALQITFFSIVFAVALAQVQGPAKALMLTFCQALCGCDVRVHRARDAVRADRRWWSDRGDRREKRHGVLRHLGALVFTLYGALIAFVLLVLLPIAMAFRVPVRRFWNATREPWLIAFSTASSEAALPLALANMERLGVPHRIASFVLPAGYAFNMDGTTLYLAMASMFVAQAAGITLPVSQQILMMLTLMLTSKGTAAVPRASLVVLSGALTQFGLPLEGVAVILGVDAFMDMARTSLNVVGNCLAAVLLARWDGSFDAAPDIAPLDARPISLRVAESPGR